MWVASSNPLRAQEQKGGGKENLISLLDLGHPSPSALGYWCSWFSGFWTQIETYAIGSPDSQALWFGLGYTTDFPELHLQVCCGTSQPP